MGTLGSLLLFVPFLGAAMGAAAGTFGGAMRVVGIDDDFISTCVRR